MSAPRRSTGRSEGGAFRRHGKRARLARGVGGARASVSGAIAVCTLPSAAAAAPLRADESRPEEKSGRLMEERSSSGTFGVWRQVGVMVDVELVLVRRWR